MLRGARRPLRPKVDLDVDNYKLHVSQSSTGQWRGVDVRGLTRKTVAASVIGMASALISLTRTFFLRFFFPGEDIFASALGVLEKDRAGMDCGRPIRPSAL